MERRAIVLLLLLLAVEVVNSSTLPSSRAFENNSLKPRDGAEHHFHCRTPGASSFYGIGVRMGVYFAQLQAWVANTFLSREVASSGDRNTMFLIALVTAMIKSSIVHTLEQLDGLILMQICAGGMFSSLSIWGYRTKRYVEEGPTAIRWFGGFGTHARLLICTVISFYGLWFWVFGVTGSLDPMSPHDDPPNPEECSELFTFMFVKLAVDGPIRIFYISFWSFWTLYYSTMLLAALFLGGYAKTATVVSLVRYRDWAGAARLRFSTGFKYRELTFIHKFLRCFNLFWLLFSVTAVEFTLNYNHVKSVLGGPNSQLHLPTQLIPFLLGVFGFMRVVWLKIKEMRDFDEKDAFQAPPSRRSSSSRRQPPRPLSGGASLFQLFSPALVTYKPKQYSEDEAEEAQSGLMRRSIFIRYLVAWMPWLSLVGNLRRESHPLAGAPLKSPDPRSSPRFDRDDIPLMKQPPVFQDTVDERGDRLSVNDARRGY